MQKVKKGTGYLISYLVSLQEEYIDATVKINMEWIDDRLKMRGIFKSIKKTFF